MNRKKVHYLIDWCVIITFLAVIWACWINHDMWNKVTYVAPVYIFLALGVLFLNHVSIIDCFKSKDIEFFLICGGMILGCINAVFIKSGIGTLFTLADFLLILYLANKIQFDKIQLGAIGVSCLLIWCYWLFIDKSVYKDTVYNPNGVSLVIFSTFCVFLCYFVFLLSSYAQISKWLYHLVILGLLYLSAKRVLSLHCRGVLAAIASWGIAYYLLPKKKFTAPVILAVSLIIPILYVWMWKSGAADGIVIYGKRLASGRDIIWYEFSKVFIRHPITGIGSDFERMLPGLYLKEVHHALLDLLFVHGIPVFLVILYLFYKRICDVITTSYSSVMAVCLASLYGMLASGTFENHYIVAPYNILLLTLFLISNTFTQHPSSAKEAAI